MNSPWSAVDDGSAGPGIAPARLVLVPLLVTVVLGIVAGLVWLWLAEPAQWEARAGGVVMTEAASRGQFAVIVVFVLVGAVASLCCGWAVARMLPALGWLLTPLVLVMTSLAAVIAWRVGVHLGPPSPDTLTDVQVGDRLPAQLAVDSIPPFLAWPVFGLLGLMSSIWADGRGVSERSGPPRPQ